MGVWVRRWNRVTFSAGASYYWLRPTDLAVGAGWDFLSHVVSLFFFSNLTGGIIDCNTV